MYVLRFGDVAESDEETDELCDDGHGKEREDKKGRLDPGKRTLKLVESTYIRFPTYWRDCFELDIGIFLLSSELQQGLFP